MASARWRQIAKATLRPVFKELADQSANAIAKKLNARGVATPTGSPWSAKTVIRVQRRLS